MERKQVTIALAGNPNSGKTTLFNQITGARQHVGNYSGVTVEKKEGYRNFGGCELSIIDLPGTYSLTTYSPEELVARNFVVQEKPDLVVNVLDASNLERNLYLALQLLELGRPMIFALNMMDVAKSRGITIDAAALAEKFGNIPVVATVGSHGKGVEELLQAMVTPQQALAFSISYGEGIEAALSKLQSQTAAYETELKFPARWLALKLLENDKDIQAKITTLAGGKELVAQSQQLRQELIAELGEDPEMAIAAKRYEFISQVYGAVTTVNNPHQETTSDKIDKILTNRLFGIPIFLGLMWVVFNLVFTLGAIPQDALTDAIGNFGKFVGQSLPDGNLKSLLVDGIIGGVGAVISFIPLILILFFAISLLEDTGYMARAAFVMDKIMNLVGLHGKSFIPLLLGFGCAVPAIMGTRTLENPRDRLVTILVTPLMSCSARLPIYS
ncbi:MAG: ferrous iron transport protein B, partial [Sporomusaceae bacterium]|nr:ferrous iron transport protein B [Sporomusaceae bacterium]